MALNEPCGCGPDQCPHFAQPSCVYQRRGDLTNANCSACTGSTWHLDGKCLRCECIQQDSK